MDEYDNANNQTAQITAKFDAGNPIDVMYWDSDPNSDTYHDHLPDEEVEVIIPNPANAQNVVLSFNLLTAYNDWWWAVDNIELRGQSGGGGVAGDYNSNGSLDAADIDTLAGAIRAGSTDTRYDVNGDASINSADHSAWVKTLKKTWFGDANLDGLFSSSDFVAVFTDGKFETGQDAGWAQGDWNGSGKFDSGDFVTAFQDGGFEAGPLPATSAVPEPTSVALLALGSLACLAARRRA
jgi:hypothetical protein